jgi:hypothetical protein
VLSIRTAGLVRPVPRLLVGAVAALVAVGVAGCSAVNPITTSRPYSPSDGVRVELGSALTAENLLVISAAKGKPGALVGGLTNRGSTGVRVSVAADGAGRVSVQVPAGATVLLGTSDNPPAAIDRVGVPPGAVLPVTISTPEGGSQQVSLPVLDGTLPAYASLVPTAAATSTSAPTATPAPAPAGTPATG